MTKQKQDHYSEYLVKNLCNASHKNRENSLAEQLIEIVRTAGGSTLDRTTIFIETIFYMTAGVH